MKDFEPNYDLHVLQVGNALTLVKGIDLLKKYADDTHGVNVSGGGDNYEPYVFLTIEHKDVVFSEKDIEAMRELGFGYLNWPESNHKTFTLFM